MHLLQKLISLLFTKLYARKHFVTSCVLVEGSLMLSLPPSFSFSLYLCAPIFEKICIRRVCKRLLFSNFRKILYLRTPWGKRISYTFLTNGSISRVDMYKESLSHVKLIRAMQHWKALKVEYSEVGGRNYANIWNNSPIAFPFAAARIVGNFIISIRKVLANKSRDINRNYNVFFAFS